MLSIPHLIIIFIVALVVFGPEKIPDLARNLGKWMGEFRRATADLRTTFEGHLRDLERETEQRRLAGTPPITVPPEPYLPPVETPVETPVENTIAARAPRAVATGAPEDEFPSTSKSSVSTVAEPSGSAPANGESSAATPAAEAAPVYNPEIAIDGNHRSA